MVKNSNGFKSRHTRSFHKKKIREKGKIRSLRYLLLREKYTPGTKVNIKIDPSEHKGQPFYRYHGQTGVITGKRGRAYIVKVKNGKKFKTLFVRPEHFQIQK
ncbi:MAG: 50S ribosomal protein L21e [Candidatus Lokiarchaeota archaeon]|nr:50S ribosomal protein L21e [Candidatus Lokiarchaeota archaeon]